jgi:hypothetical protein
MKKYRHIPTGRIYEWAKNGSHPEGIYRCIEPHCFVQEVGIVENPSSKDWEEIKESTYFVDKDWSIVEVQAGYMNPIYNIKKMCNTREEAEQYIMDNRPCVPWGIIEKFFDDMWNGDYSGFLPGTQKIVDEIKKYKP